MAKTLWTSVYTESPKQNSPRPTFARIELSPEVLSNLRDKLRRRGAKPGSISASVGCPSAWGSPDGFLGGPFVDLSRHELIVTHRGFYFTVESDSAHQTPMISLEQLERFVSSPYEHVFAAPSIDDLRADIRACNPRLIPGESDGSRSEVEGCAYVVIHQSHSFSQRQLYVADSYADAKAFQDRRGQAYRCSKVLHVPQELAAMGDDLYNFIDRLLEESASLDRAGVPA